MYYVVDRFWRVIANSADLNVARSLANRIAEAGAWVAVATDDEKEAAAQGGFVKSPQGGWPRLGPSKAWSMENDPEDGIQTPAEKLDEIVGRMDETPQGDEGKET